MFLKDYIIYKKVPNYFTNDKQTLSSFSNVDCKIPINSIYELIKKMNIIINEMKMSSNPKLIFEVSLLNYNINEEKELNIKNNVNIKGDNENKIDKKSDEIKKIRVNNVMAKANKSFLKNIKKKWVNIESYVVDSVHGPAAGILVDSDLKAAGDNNILITFKYESMVNRVNNNLKNIEKSLNKILESQYKIIAVTEEEWNKIKEEYIEKLNKSEKYETIEEPIYEEIFSKQEKEMDEFLKMTVDLFGKNIIEIK